MKWTNKSVLQFSGIENPIERMESYARDIALEAMDKGWSGPPFDPIKLADVLKIPVVPNSSVNEASTVPTNTGEIEIQFNPTKPRARVRFSIAHEIAHTFFVDCADNVRHRNSKERTEKDEWQLEMLCNVGAAELIMPIGSLRNDINRSWSIEDILNMRREYDVSTEALLIRIAKKTELDMAVFCGSVINESSAKQRYKIDYIIPSINWSGNIVAGYLFPENSAIYECTAIGFTSRGHSVLGKPGKKYEIECVGLPAYHGSSSPRIAGLLKKASTQELKRKEISYIRSDALSPNGKANHIIAHVVNDQTPNWGGRGFAVAVKRKWPHVQKAFKTWTASRRGTLSIGNHCLIEAESGVHIFNMVAQKGYGPSDKPRIRYSGLEACLHELANIALENNSDVTMPRIGSGYAGGDWNIIEEMIREALVERGINVTVCDLPEKKKLAATDGFLEDLFS